MRVSHFYVKFFVTVPTNSWENLSFFQKKIRNSETLCIGWGASRFYGKNTEKLSHSSKKIVKEPSNVSENYWHRKISCIEGFTSRFCRKKLSQCEKISWGKLSISQKFSGIKNFHASEMDITVFSKIFWCLTVPKRTAGENFGVHENFEYGKSLNIGRGYQYSPWKSFCLAKPKKISERSFCVSKKMGIENFHALEGGGASLFCRKFFGASQRREKL